MAGALAVLSQFNEVAEGAVALEDDQILSPRRSCWRFSDVNEQLSWVASLSGY